MTVGGVDQKVKVKWTLSSAALTYTIVYGIFRITKSVCDILDMVSTEC